MRLYGAFSTTHGQLNSFTLPESPTVARSSPSPSGAGPRSHALTSVPSTDSPLIPLGQMPITLKPSVHVCVSHRSSRIAFLTCVPVLPS